MQSIVDLMPDLFDLYFYDQYILDWWWYGAFTAGEYRSDEDNWWNNVYEYDMAMEEMGTYKDIEYYLD